MLNDRWMMHDIIAEEYDFYRGMHISSEVKVDFLTDYGKTQRKFVELSIHHYECGYSYADSNKSSTNVFGDNCKRLVKLLTSDCRDHDTKCTYFKNIYNFDQYTGVISHEFGHVFQLADAYYNQNPHFDNYHTSYYEPSPNQNELYYNDSLGQYYKNSGLIMRNCGSANLNDVEMVIYGIKENKSQYYTYGKEYGEVCTEGSGEHTLSKAIKSRPLYFRKEIKRDNKGNISYSYWYI